MIQPTGRHRRSPVRVAAALAGAALLATAPAVLGAVPTAATAGQPDRTVPQETTTTDDDRPTTTRGPSTTDGPTTTEREPATTTTADEPTTTTEGEEDEPSTTTTADESDDTSTDDTSTDDAGDGGSGGPLMLVLGVLLGASAGAAIGWFAGRQAPGARHAATADAAAGGPIGGTSAVVADQRATLVSATIAAIDLAQNAGVREQLTRALEAAGVRPLSVDGEAFDPNRHHAVDRLTTHDRNQHNTVLTDRPGWIDGDRVLRLPDVIVYRAE